MDCEAAECETLDTLPLTSRSTATFVDNSWGFKHEEEASFLISKDLSKNFCFVRAELGKGKKKKKKNVSKTL